MPRNPSKRPCQVPGCRNWAMRANTRCRPHRDQELGPRGAGAPAGNLNALHTGQHANPLTPDQLDDLVTAILSSPDQLPLHLEPTIRSIHHRCRDPVKTLLSIQALLPDLLSNVAAGLFEAEFTVLLQQQPPDRRNQVKYSILRQALRFGSLHRLQFLRRLRPHLQPQPDPSPVLIPDLLPPIKDIPSPWLQSSAFHQVGTENTENPANKDTSPDD